MCDQSAERLGEFMRAAQLPDRSRCRERLEDIIEVFRVRSNNHGATRLDRLEEVLPSVRIKTFADKSECCSFVETRQQCHAIHHETLLILDTAFPGPETRPQSASPREARDRRTPFHVSRRDDQAQTRMRSRASLERAQHSRLFSGMRAGREDIRESPQLSEFRGIGCVPMCRIEFHVSRDDGAARAQSGEAPCVVFALGKNGVGDGEKGSSEAPESPISSLVAPGHSPVYDEDGDAARLRLDKMVRPQFRFAQDNRPRLQSIESAFHRAFGIHREPADAILRPLP